MNEEQKQPKQKRKAWSIAIVMHRLFPKNYKTIEVVVPLGFMNCAVSTRNNFIADTNCSSEWDTLRFPLPKPRYKWRIKCYKGDMDKPEKKTVVLIDKPK